MATILENGDIKFGDGTTLASANIPYANITGKKTNLTQFTNNLGNYGDPTYGAFLVAANINTAAIGTGAFASMAINANVTTGALFLTTNNCNCNCNCNC